MNANPRIHLLARSLFALFLMMTLTGLVSVPFMLFSGGEGKFLAAYGLLLLVIMGTVYLFRLGEAATLEHLMRILPAPRDNIFAGIVSAALGGLALLALYWIVEAEPARLTVLGVLLLVWCVLWGVLLAAMYWRGIKRLLRGVQPLLTGIGVAVLLLLVEGIIQVFDALNPDEVQIDDVDVRPQTWTTITDTEIPWAEQYWLEYGYASRAVEWTPYVYWRMKAYDGEYVNVDERGIRYTPPAGEPDMMIYVYGGSTVWGHGARDEHTIPAELVRAMSEHGIAADVTNFGELGYISRQDATLFDLQLAIDNIPDVAIFYWGFNDINTIYAEHYPGLTSSEKDPRARFEGVQCVLDLSTPVLLNALLYKTDSGSRLLRSLNILPINPAEGCALGNMDWQGVNTVLVAQQNDDPTAVAAFIAHMVRQVESMADAYDVQPLIIWQPAIFQKDPLSWYEQQIVQEERWRELGSYYNAVDAEIRKTLGDNPNVLIWTDFFQNVDKTINIFIDKVHITEEGNAMVADGIADYLTP